MLVNTAPGKLRQEYCHESETSLGYTVGIPGQPELQTKVLPQNKYDQIKK